MAKNLRLVTGPVIPGGCNACTRLVTVNQSTGNVTYDAGYYSVGHFSKFALPGHGIAAYEWKPA